MMNKEKIIELKNAMDDLEQIDAVLFLKKEKFEEDNSELFMKQAKTREVIHDCKAILTENAEVGYAKDSVKKRLGGIGIRVSKLLIYDEAKALIWAKDKDLFLQLDKKAFDNVAKTGEIDFVSFKDKITVTFPKKISLEEYDE